MRAIGANRRGVRPGGAVRSRLARRSRKLSIHTVRRLEQYDLAEDVDDAGQQNADDHAVDRRVAHKSRQQRLPERERQRRDENDKPAHPQQKAVRQADTVPFGRNFENLAFSHYGSDGGGLPAGIVEPVGVEPVGVEPVGVEPVDTAPGCAATAADGGSPADGPGAAGGIRSVRIGRGPRGSGGCPSAAADASAALAGSAATGAESAGAEDAGGVLVTVVAGRRVAAGASLSCVSFSDADTRRVGSKSPKPPCRTTKMPAVSANAAMATLHSPARGIAQPKRGCRAGAVVVAGFMSRHGLHAPGFTQPGGPAASILGKMRQGSRWSRQATSKIARPAKPVPGVMSRRPRCAPARGSRHRRGSAPPAAGADGCWRPGYRRMSASSGRPRDH